MTTTAMPVFDQLATLIAFPRRPLAPVARACAAAVRARSPEAAADLQHFADAVEHQRLPVLQEHYSATFDFDPSCALELGWHLYGNTFERGAFLAQLRGELDRAGVGEVEGLPDHLVHILSLLGREDLASASHHVAMLRPSISAIRGKLQERHSLYVHLFTAIEAAIAALLAGRLQEASTT